jgi:hypothetical protein
MADQKQKYDAALLQHQQQATAQQQQLQGTIRQLQDMQRQLEEAQAAAADAKQQREDAVQLQIRTRDDYHKLHSSHQVGYASNKVASVCFFNMFYAVHAEELHSAELCKH